MRLDADSVAAEGVAATLERFEAAPSAVLVGTQMVAKGHDFAGVTLGVVLDADNTLRFPDFRAEERTFALVAQLAGRSGRGSDRGRVVVQALDPEAAGAAVRRPPRLRRLPARRAGPPQGAVLPALRAPGARSSAPAPSPAPSTRPPPRCATGWTRRAPPVLGPVPLFRRQGKDRAQLVVRGPDREGQIAAVRDGRGGDRPRRSAARAWR